MNELNFPILKLVKDWFKDFFYSWFELVKILLKRFFAGLKNSNFVIYFVVIIVFIGGFGVFKDIYAIINCEDGSELSRLYNELSKNLSTYFIALIAASTADLILNRLPNERESFILRMPAITGLVAGGFLLFLIQLEVVNNTFKLAIWGTILAWIMWWISNSTDPKHKEPKEPNEPLNPMGGLLEDPDGRGDGVNLVAEQKVEGVNF
jgi:hypothetical protein